MNPSVNEKPKKNWLAIGLGIALVLSLTNNYLTKKAEEKKREILAGLIAEKMVNVWKEAYMEGMTDKYEEVVRIAKGRKDTLLKESFKKLQDKVNEILTAPKETEKEEKRVTIAKG